MSDVAAIDSLVKKFEDLKAEIGNVIIGQEQAVNYVLLAIFCGGHSLLIGVPGLAKTLLVHTVSDALGLIAEDLTKAGASILGEWPTDGYEFNKSVYRRVCFIITY